MFSNNKNIEEICELISEVRDYALLRFEACRIDFVTKLATLLAAVALGGILLAFMAIALLFLSYTAELALESWLDNAIAAYALVALGYVVLGGIVYALRRVLIVQPLMRLLAGLLLGKPKRMNKDRKGGDYEP